LYAAELYVRMKAVPMLSNRALAVSLVVLPHTVDAAEGTARVAAAMPKHAAEARHALNRTNDQARSFVAFIQ